MTAKPNALGAAVPALPLRARGHGVHGPAVELHRPVGEQPSRRPINHTSSTARGDSAGVDETGALCGRVLATMLGRR